jgi:transposase
VSLSNQIRGLLLEYGIDITQGFSKLKEKIPVLLDPSNEQLTAQMKEVLSDCYEEFKELSKRIDGYDKRLGRLSMEHESCKLLRSIPGIGPISAIALYSSVGNGSQFKNGREMAAHIGLVPKQHSSGERQVLLGITNKGDGNLKHLLIHGGRTVALHAGKKKDWRSEWINKLAQNKHANVVATAIANRTARIAWAVLTTGRPYRIEDAELREGGRLLPTALSCSPQDGGLRA